MIKKNGFLRIVIDTYGSRRTFAANGLPKEWDGNFENVDMGDLVAALRTRLDNAHAGMVVTFPIAYVLTVEKLHQATALGVNPILVWGTREACFEAARTRAHRKGGTFDSTAYEQATNPAFLAYGRPEYDVFRVHTFRDDGSRRPYRHVIADIVDRLVAAESEPHPQPPQGVAGV